MNTHNKRVNKRAATDLDDRKMRGLALKDVMETALSERQMSVSGLAREANVQRGDIYRWWRGESRPTRNSLARVAETLQVDTGLLRTALGEPTVATPPDALVSALLRQSAAIEALVVEIRDAARSLYPDGPPPVPEPESPVAASAEEGLRRGQRHQPPEAPDTPSPSPARPPRGNGGGYE